MKWLKDFRPINKIIAVDFDGTLVEDKFPEIGSPRKDIVEWVKECRLNGCKLILWTSRSNNLKVNGCGSLELAVEYCKESLDLEFDAINENLKEVQEKWHNDTRKVYADYYIDDKAIMV
jgi:predicted HAD superfamily phosphohydrolase YqeG